MRLLGLLAALVFVAGPLVGVAHADGIERPHRPVNHHHARPHVQPRRAPVPLVPIRASGPETVMLTQAFFAGSSGGVGADIGTGYIGGGTIVVQSGGGASAFAFASARASAGARGGGHFGGHGGGCGCH